MPAGSEAGVISLLTDDEEDRPREPSPAPQVPRRGAIKKKRRRGAGWRRRAGDASTQGEPVPPALAAAASASAKSSTADELRSALRAFGLRPGVRTKEALALRLLRAQHAASASENAYGEMPAPGAGRRPRFDSERAGRVDGSLEACRLCAASIAPPRRTFCSDECVHFHLLRTSGSHVRKAAAIRDGCVCALCGVDAGAAFTAARAAVRQAVAVGAPPPAEALEQSVRNGPFSGHASLTTMTQRGRAKVREGSFWQVDHVRPVADGGGCCGLANLRTLCTPCHAQVTARAAGQRAADRRAGREEEQERERWLAVARTGMGVELADDGDVEDEDEDEDDDDDDDEDSEDKNGGGASGGGGSGDD